MIPSADDRPPTYVLLSGSGRSGSNNLLDILDCHPDTVCRSEPETPGMRLGSLPKGGFRPGDEPEPFPSDFLALWREAIAAARWHNGTRDHFIADHKAWFRHPLLARAFQPVFGSAKARRWMARIAPAYGAAEWPIPRLYASRTHLMRATAVFKIDCAAGWIGRVFDAEPNLRVIHNVRSPSGFVQSWYNRYVLAARGGDARAVHAQNLQHLDIFMRHYGATWRHGSTYSDIALIEAQLWRWRYFNEAMIDMSYHADRYMMITYDEVMRDREGIAARVMAFCGLEPDPAALARATGLERWLFKQQHATALDQDLVEAAIERVVAGSTIATLLAQRAPAAPAV